MDLHNGRLYWPTTLKDKKRSFDKHYDVAIIGGGRKSATIPIPKLLLQLFQSSIFSNDHPLAMINGSIINNPYEFITEILINSEM
ncbi:MAG: hypothetical protein ACQEWI_18905 [Bacillota bacterium]